MQGRERLYPVLEASNQPERLETIDRLGGELHLGARFARILAPVAAVPVAAARSSAVSPAACASR